MINDAIFQNLNRIEVWQHDDCPYNLNRVLVSGRRINSSRCDNTSDHTVLCSKSALYY